MNASASDPYLHDFWYVAAHGAEIARGKTLARTLLGQQILLGRDNEGAVFALRDFCPHRGMPLRYGTFNGCEIECCYHGWRFATNGQCTSVPSLAPDEKVDIARIKTPSYPCREINGVIWVYMAQPGVRSTEIETQPWAMPMSEDARFYHVDSVTFPCGIDHAIIGLMDPSHGPFVHASWWWRSARSMHVKRKPFAPVAHGFRMLSHKPSSNSRAYKILVGGEVKTEITFQLPGIRVEHIQMGEKHRIVLLTALTPISENETRLHQYLFTTLPLLNALRPLLKPFGKAFIRQDLEIVRKQQEGLSSDHPALMLLGNADQQALWYYKLKREWLESRAEQRAFENRLPEKVLEWRS